LPSTSVTPFAETRAAIDPCSPRSCTALDPSPERITVKRVGAFSCDLAWSPLADEVEFELLVDTAAGTTDGAEAGLVALATAAWLEAVDAAVIGAVAGPAIVGIVVETELDVAEGELVLRPELAPAAAVPVSFVFVAGIEGDPAPVWVPVDPVPDEDPEPGVDGGTTGGALVPVEPLLSSVPEPDVVGAGCALSSEESSVCDVVLLEPVCAGFWLVPPPADDDLVAALCCSARSSDSEDELTVVLATTPVATGR
jgi:hypothetical protein